MHDIHADNMMPGDQKGLDLDSFRCLRRQQHRAMTGSIYGHPTAARGESSGADKLRTWVPVRYSCAPQDTACPLLSWRRVECWRMRRDATRGA